MSNNKNENHLEAEYENSPVPLSARKSLWSVTMIWLGFPMIISVSAIGALLVTSLGFYKGIMAILLGNFILFSYVGLLGVLGTRKGYNFTLQSSVTFGKKGAKVVSALLSTLVIGWFAVQVGMVGDRVHQAFGSNIFVITLLAGIAYLVLTLFGIKALTYIGIISAPLFFLVGTWVSYEVIAKVGWEVISSSEGNNAFSFGTGLTIVVGTFLDSGTLTSDFNRWSKNSKESVFATFSAFPFANSVALIFGAVLAGAAMKNPDVFLFLTNKGSAVWSVFALIVLVINLGSVCAHCLYNGAVGWAAILGGKMRSTATVLGIIGTIIAISGIWAYFDKWLIMLGVIIPSIGAIIIVDQFIVRKGASIASASSLYNSKAFVAWAIGAVSGIITEVYIPSLSTAVITMLLGGGAYYLLTLKTKEQWVPEKE